MCREIDALEIYNENQIYISIILILMIFIVLRMSDVGRFWNLDKYKSRLSRFDLWLWIGDFFLKATFASAKNPNDCANPICFCDF